MLSPDDLYEVLVLENLCYVNNHWTLEQFKSCLCEENCYGLICVENEDVVGFAIYLLLDFHLAILNFAVHPNKRRQGVGSQMFYRLVKIGEAYNLQEVVLEVRETNIRMQKFLQSQNCLAKHVLNGHYPDGETAYQFVRKL
ncbi:MAG: GNAT family N-acetyltransferase [Patescibacteria group bacterium]|nr:GNAT family N-acetyltransferase [Patescibacteria group bacterium]